MSLNCRLCKEKGETISSHHTSPRRCGFDENGVFTSGNYNCATLMAIRHVATRLGLVVPCAGEDGVDHHRVDYAAPTGKTMHLKWYKSRGATEQCIISNRLGTAINAEIMLDYLETDALELPEDEEVSPQEQARQFERVEEKMIKNGFSGATVPPNYFNLWSK